MNPYVIYACFNIVTGLYAFSSEKSMLMNTCVVFGRWKNHNCYMILCFILDSTFLLRSQKTTILYIFDKNLDAMSHAWYSLKERSTLNLWMLIRLLFSSKFIWILKFWEVVAMSKYRANYNIHNEYHCCHFAKFISIVHLSCNGKVEIQLFRYPV